MCVLLLLLLLYLRERVLRQCGSVWHTFKALHEYIHSEKCRSGSRHRRHHRHHRGYGEVADVLEMLTKMLL